MPNKFKIQELEYQILHFKQNNMLPSGKQYDQPNLSSTDCKAASELYIC